MAPFILSCALFAQTALGTDPQQLSSELPPSLLPEPPYCPTTCGHVKAKAAYYYPSDATFRAIYSGGPVFGVEGSIALWRDLFAYAGANFLSVSGHSIGSRHHCNLLFIPLELGARYTFIPQEHIRCYLGAGIAPSYVREQCHSPFILHTTRQWGCGGSFQVGMTLSIKSNIFVDVFCDYVLVSMQFANTAKSVGNDADLSGLAAGGAIGYRF